MKFYLSLLLILFAADAPGQTPAPPQAASLPSGPLLARLPDFAKWKITITDTNPTLPQSAAQEQTGSNPASNQQPGKEKTLKTVIQMTKTLPLRLIESSNNRGGRSSVWCVGKMQIHQSKVFTKPTLFSEPDPFNTYYMDFSGSDFPDFQWVSSKNFVGVQQTGDRQYLFFREKIQTVTKEVMEEARNEAEKIKAGSFLPEVYFAQSEAYIDSETRLPIGLKRGSETHIYTYEPAPSEMLALPSSLRGMIDFEQQRSKDLAREPALP